MEIAQKIIGWILSPSRMIFDKEKTCCEDRTEFYKKWSVRFFCLELSLSFLLIVFSNYEQLNKYILLSIILLLLAWSRINEVAYAFYCDSFSHLNKKEPSSGLTMPERAQMALRSYIGVIIYFAFIYYFYWSENKFHSEIQNFFESLYFSTITIATVGYGDNYPSDSLMKFFVMYEVILGLLLVVVVIGTYLSGSNNMNNETDAKKINLND